jgi:hypothetical protein
VVRFPVERRARPTLQLVREIAPDVREVLAITETLNLEPPPHGLREAVDAETTQYILDQFGGVGGISPVVLTDLLTPVIEAAVTACHAASDVLLDASDARQALARANAAGGYWLAPLRESAEALTFRAAGLLLTAYIAAEKAEGVARAVGMALRGETWTPRSVDNETDELIRMAG